MIVEDIEYMSETVGEPSQIEAITEQIIVVNEKLDSLNENLLALNNNFYIFVAIVVVYGVFKIGYRFINQSM